MLDVINNKNATWKPHRLSYEELNKRLSEVTLEDGVETEWLVILKIEPYIDSVFVQYDANDHSYPAITKRFVFCEDYCWDFEEEIFFTNRCLNNSKCGLSYGEIKPIFKTYSSKYPDWKLKRYYTKPFRILDHIYNCMKKNTAKEILYKAGLDELAANITDMDEINLLASCPTDIYDGVSIRTLRALNCRNGSVLLSTAYNRSFIKELQMKFPDIFAQPLNDAQSRYLNRLITGDLAVGEAGRLYKSRSKYLLSVWNHSLYELFISKERTQEEAEALKKIDPYYKQYIFWRPKFSCSQDSRVDQLSYYLLYRREDYDRKIRRSNRKRNNDWQERNHGYVVRYPQTINDFCREAVYMSNCLLTYVDALINNDTTILFIRKCDDIDTPFITMEIYDGQLMQAYRRHNNVCSREEKEWIIEYCNRHNIECEKFKSNRNWEVW